MKNIPTNLLMAAIVAAHASTATAATFFGVTVDNELVSFDSSAPGAFLTNTPITGLFASDGVTPDPSAFVANLSYNAVSGQLLAIDSNANIYRLNITGGTVLLNNTFSPIGFGAGVSYDFITDAHLYADDAAGRFNITSAGTVTALADAAYAAGDPNAPSSPELFGVAVDTGLGGSAFFIDSNLNILANAFDVAAVELNTVGNLGLDVTSFGDLAIDFDGNLFASLSGNGLDSGFYSIDPTTGAASLVGAFSKGVGTVTIPEPSAALLAGLGVLGFIARRRRN